MRALATSLLLFMAVAAALAHGRAVDDGSHNLEPPQQPSSAAGESRGGGSEVTADDFVHKATARVADRRHQYAQADELDVGLVEERGQEADADDRRDVMAAEVRNRCFGSADEPANADDKSFCSAQQEILKSEEEDLKAATTAVVDLILLEAGGVVTEEKEKRMKEVHADFLARPRPASPAQEKEIEEELLRNIEESQDAEGTEESPAPSVASGTPAPTPEQQPATGQTPDQNAKPSLVQLTERVRRHLSTAGLESRNPLETSAKKLWPQTVPYAFFNPPSDHRFGLMDGSSVNYGWWRASVAGFFKGKLVRKTAEKAWPYYGKSLMLDPSELVVIKQVTPAIVKMFRAAVRHLEELTCLKFQEVAADADVDKILVAQDGIMENGAASFGVGRTMDRFKLPHGGKHGLHLIKIGKGLPVIGAVVHEILHALGLGHTQQRADSKTFLKHFPNNMQPDWKAQYTPDDQPKEWFVTPVDSQAFDFGSVMSYPAWSSKMATATALANAASTDKNAKGEIRMLESLVPADLRRRALNEDPDSGGLGQCVAAQQGRMSYVDAEILNVHYKCSTKLRKLPANSQIVPEDAKAKEELRKAKPFCECPTDKYAGRVSSKVDCLKEPSDWASDVAEVIRTSMPETKKAAVAKFPPAVPLLRKKSEAKKPEDAKEEAEKERNSIVEYLGESLSQFIGDCRKYCSTRPEYKAAKCWVNAIKFAGPLAVDSSDTGVPSVPWKFQCGKQTKWKEYGCFL